MELVEGPEVTARTNQAVVRWRLDSAAGGRVRYGTHPTRLEFRAQSPVGTEHRVVLDGLRVGTRYFFSVGTARVVLATNSWVTLGGAEPAAGAGASQPTPHATTANSGVTASAPPTGPPAVTPPPSAPPARVTWGSLRTLQVHFDRHGRDFAAKDPEDYARQAWLFLQRAKQDGLPAKRDVEGVLRVYDPKTRAFAAYNRDETTRTYFKPGRRGYFDDQPGTSVDLRPAKPATPASR